MGSLLSWLQSVVSARQSSLPTAPSRGRNAAEVVAPPTVIIRVHSSEKHPQPNGEPAQHPEFKFSQTDHLTDRTPFFLFFFWVVKRKLTECIRLASWQQWAH